MIWKILRRLYLFLCFLSALPFLIMKKFVSYIYVSELISLLPFRAGEHIRYFFYKQTLASCGENVVISWGTIISYPDASIGNHVWIGACSTVGLVEIGDYTLIAQSCHLLSGSHHHGIEDLSTPIRHQPGESEKISIGRDVWIGANSTVMADIGQGCVLGAGSVVTKRIKDYSVAAGNPARVIRSRNQSVSF